MQVSSRGAQLARFKWNFLQEESRETQHTSFIIFPSELRLAVLIPSVASRQSVTRKYSFFLHLLGFHLFFPPQLRFAFFPSYHILDHHLICPRILLLPEMSRECITAAWRIHLSTTTTRFESIPGFAEKYTSFLTPRRHRDASLGAAPDNRIVCYTTLHLSRRGFSREKKKTRQTLSGNYIERTVLFDI